MQREREKEYMYYSYYSTTQRVADEKKHAGSVYTTTRWCWHIAFYSFVCP